MASNSVWKILHILTRSSGLPDKGYFGHIAGSTGTPLRAIWFTTTLSIIPGFLDLASPIAANAIFALTAIALDLSYIIPIFL
jgi:amino acid transporter